MYDYMMMCVCVCQYVYFLMGHSWTYIEYVGMFQKLLFASDSKPDISARLYHPSGNSLILSVLSQHSLVGDIPVMLGNSAVT